MDFLKRKSRLWFNRLCI